MKEVDIQYKPFHKELWAWIESGSNEPFIENCRFTGAEYCRKFRCPLDEQSDAIWEVQTGAESAALWGLYDRKSGRLLPYDASSYCVNTALDSKEDFLCVLTQITESHIRKAVEESRPSATLAELDAGTAPVSLLEVRQAYLAGASHPTYFAKNALDLPPETMIKALRDPDVFAAQFAEQWLSKSPEGCRNGETKTNADVCRKAWEKYCLLSSLMHELLKTPEHPLNTVQDMYEALRTCKGKNVQAAVERSDGGEDVLTIPVQAMRSALFWYGDALQGLPVSGVVWIRYRGKVLYERKQTAEAA